MPALEIEIINKLGLHARASAKFVGVAGQFKDCTIRVGRTPDSTVDGNHHSGACFGYLAKRPAIEAIALFKPMGHIKVRGCTEQMQHLP